MDQNKNFFQLIGDWWANRQSDHKKRPNLSKWLPTPGNVIFMILVLGLLIVTQGVWAAPLQRALNAPGPSATTVNYQGRLADKDGTPLDGTYGMSFALYDVVTDGNLIWGPEQHMAVEVSDGLFSVGLGSQTSGGIPTTTWNGDRYLEITVDGETLEPRELIRSVPIAGMALTVPEGAIDSDQLANESVTPAKLENHLCCGSTNPDGTGWKTYKDSGMYIKADTSSCGFSSTPMYFTSLAGDTQHWTAAGVTNIYSQTATGFKVYITRNDPSVADEKNWHVQWCGVEK